MITDLNNERRRIHEALALRHVQELPPRPVQPPGEPQQLLRRQVHGGLGEQGAFPVAVDLELPVVPMAAPPQPARERIVVHQHPREGLLQGLRGNGGLEDVEVLDGEPEEVLVVEVREVEGAGRGRGRWPDQGRRGRVEAVGELGGRRRKRCFHVSV